jgi:hypothetical protein
MISAGGGFLSSLGPFGAILIDEVAQCTELAALVPIVQRGCHRHAKKNENLWLNL